MTKYITYHDKPIFRDNYNLSNGAIEFPNTGHLVFRYCENNKMWLAFKGGDEVGVLNNEGIQFAENYYK